MSEGRFALLDALIDRYNAGDAEGYAAFFAEDGSEGLYRGETLRAGRDAVREGNAKTFAEFPENRVEVLNRFALGDYVLLHERVWRTAQGTPFDVMTIYAFAGDKIERVEFVK